MAEQEQNVIIDYATEKSAIGAALVSDYAAEYLTEALVASDFGNPAYSEIFQAMCELKKRDTKIDTLTVRTELIARGTLDVCGGVAFLQDCASFVISPSNAPDYAKILKAHALKRATRNACIEAANAASAVGADAEKVLETLETSLTDAEKSYAQGAADTLEPAKLAEAFRAELAKPISHIFLPFTWLNELTGGLSGGNLCTICGRPGAGKSSFALACASFIATTRRVVYATIEMTATEMLGRLLAQEAGVSTKKISMHELDFERDTAARKALEDYEKSKLFFATGVRTTRDVERILRINKPEVIFVDSVNLMRASGESERVKLLNITRELKQIALTLEVPIVITAQLSRKAEEKSSPTLADVKESGSIEEDSDIVLLLSEVATTAKLENLWEEDKSGLADMEQWRELKTRGDRLILAQLSKNRNGACGRKSFCFEGKRFRFTELGEATSSQFCIETLNDGEPCPF